MTSKPTPSSGDARPLILLANDDGVGARGLIALRDALAEHADVVVCAPESNQSATSHSLTLHRPLRLRAVRDGVFALDGTPADCVYVAVHAKGRLLPRSPDLVVSGMNHGPNLGDDVFYSGTVAAAREGALKGIPALAVSADLEAASAPAARLGAQVALQLASRLPTRRSQGLLLNLNIPRGDGWKLRGTRLGSRIYSQEVEFRVDPRGREYLWIGGPPAVQHGQVDGSDTEAYDEGVASLTALTLDLCAADEAPFVAELARAVG